MPDAVLVPKSTDQDINGVLSGRKWDSLTLTFSFPALASFYSANYGSGKAFNNFEALNPVQSDAVRTIFGMISSVTNLEFVEMVETITSQATLRFGMSDAPGTAWGYYPYGGEVGGDSWYNNSSGMYDAPVVGNYAFHTFMHEIGHTLGLKHGHSEDGADYEGLGVMTAEHDSMEFSIMTYRSYVGHASVGYTNEKWGFAQSLMMYDIAALQYLYGADFTTNRGNTIYSWDPATGQMSIDGVSQGLPGGNRVFRTVWDGGGVDTYDFSNYSTNLVVNLSPGEWSKISDAQIARLGNGQYARGNIANALLYQGDTRSLIENAVGGSGNDQITGNQADNDLSGNAGSDILFGGLGNDTLRGGLGADILDGGEGAWDWAVYYEKSSSVQVTLNGSNSATVCVGGLAEDVLRSIEGVTGGTANDTLTGDELDNGLIGWLGDDALFGGAGNDKFWGNAGNDTIDGGAGDFDTAFYDGSRSDFQISLDATGKFLIQDLRAGGEGTDILSGVEYFAFNDVMVRSDSFVRSAPGAISTSSNVVAENSRAGVAVGVLAAADPDSGDSHSFSLLTNAGGRFYLAGNVLMVADGSLLDFEQAKTHTVTVRATDRYGLSVDQTITVSVADVLNEVVVGTTRNDVFYGGAGSDQITGGAGADVLKGGAGRDILNGGTGKDTLTGGDGKDTFVFNTALNATTNVDRITDFSVKDDTIRIDNAYFKKIGSGTASKPGKLNADFFHIGTKAADFEDRIIYNRDKGYLYYDADGIGASKQVLFAILPKKLALTAADFLVI